MITVESRTAQPSGKVKFSLRGLQADTKPTQTFQGEGIGNGSEFVEMDSSEIYLYDEESDTWKEF